MIKTRRIFTLILFFLLAITSVAWLIAANFRTSILLTPNTYKSSQTIDFYPLFAVTDKLTAIQSVKLKEILAREFKEKSEKAEAILKRYNSPLKGLGHIFVRRADECGGDYKILLAIAGNESGFGKINYKRYNPFGYLDGVQYASFEDAINVITCKISERFIKPCNRDLNCIVRTYGGSDTDKPKWVYNINWFMQQI